MNNKDSILITMYVVFLVGTFPLSLILFGTLGIFIWLILHFIIASVISIFVENKNKDSSENSDKSKIDFFHKPTLIASTIIMVIIILCSFSFKYDSFDNRYNNTSSSEYEYNNHCWKCKSNVNNSMNRCSECGWYICRKCGAHRPGCSG
jgi:amino acid transporter